MSPIILLRHDRPKGFEAQRQLLKRYVGTGASLFAGMFVVYLIYQVKFFFSVQRWGLFWFVCHF